MPFPPSHISPQQRLAHPPFPPPVLDFRVGVAIALGSDFQAVLQGVPFTGWAVKGGGMQSVWGEENVTENALSRKFLDPSKRASGLLCRGFLYTKNRALTNLNVPYEVGSKTPFSEGCHL